MEQLIIPATQLGTGVFTTLLFLWFLTKLLKAQSETQAIRDKADTAASIRRSKSDVKMARALEKLSVIVEKNSTTNVNLTAKTDESVDASRKNTGALKEVTEVVKVNGSGK